MKFDIPVGKILSGVSPSMRREWIEMPQRVALPTRHLSPSMRREWIEISEDFIKELFGIVSLHAEGVD